jgi:hypothetical protein
MKPQAGEFGELSLCYPVFAVLSAELNDETNLIVVELEGKDSLPLFRTRELAELYLEQVQNTEPQSPLVLHECHDHEELEHLLLQLPASVADVIWDATLRPQVVRITAVRDLLEVIRGDSQSQLET